MQIARVRHLVDLLAATARTVEEAAADASRHLEVVRRMCADVTRARDDAAVKAATPTRVVLPGDRPIDR